MLNLHVITFKLIPQTDKKPKRIRVSNQFINTTIPYKDLTTFSGLLANGQKWCQDKNLNIIGYEEGDKHVSIITTNIR